LRTEKAYIYWVRLFVRWRGMHHPREMGPTEVQAFLTMLAAQRQVSSSTHNQALSALLLLYREVLGVQLPWMTDLQRPSYTRRIPAVLNTQEVSRLLAGIDGEIALVAKVLYGTGMRLMEALRLRVKDVDFERRAIIVREAKGNKDRVVMLPSSLVMALRDQAMRARAVWKQDRAAQHAGVEVPHALEGKYPSVGSRGGGSGCSRHRAWPPTPAVVSCAGTTSTRSDCNARSRRPLREPAFTSEVLRIPCATALPLTCYRLARIYARFRSCWVTRM